MQSKTVMAFRKRLKNRGYSHIQIYSIIDEPSFYYVSAVEPLFSRVVSGKLNEIQMYHWR